MDYLDGTFGVSSALLLTAVLTAVPLGLCLVVGLLSGLIQAATQVQEQTLTLVPKLLCFASLLYFFGERVIGILAEMYIDACHSLGAV